jgi:hypothetical protein
MVHADGFILEDDVALRQGNQIDLAEPLGRQLGEDIELLCRQAFSTLKHGKIQVAFAVNPPGCAGPEQIDRPDIRVLAEHRLQVFEIGDSNSGNIRVWGGGVKGAVRVAPV